MDWPSSLISVLASISLRALIVAGIARLLLSIGRDRLEPARHAIWTLVTVGMLLALPATLLPRIPLRVLNAPPTVASETAATISANPHWEISSKPLPVEQRISWQQVLAFLYGAGVAIFLLRLAFGYRLTRRLVQQGRKLELPLAANVHESNCISVPMTTGWLQPKILLPPSWREWDGAKLRAVLAHERAHVERVDWLIGAIAAINRSIFWFHPLAWWLERTLPGLAEEACDDAALRAVESREEYATVLLEMAAAVQSRRSRTIWEAMAMARTPEVHTRINRILDETRPIPLPFSRRACAGLLACGLPFICAISVLQLAPARAMPQDHTAAEAVPSPQTAGPQAPEKQSPPATREKSSSRTARLEPVKTVKAEYPTAALVSNIQGNVRLSIIVGKDGTVSDVTSAAGHPLLIPPAIEAVRHWIYSPQRAAVHLQVEVPFTSDHTFKPPTGQEPARAVPAASFVTLTPISRVEPEFPRFAREVGAYGLVETMAAVGKDGHVIAVEVMRGHPLFKQAAKDAVMQWVYPPQASVVITNAEVNFPRPDASASNGQIQPAVLLSRKEPAYPMEARRAGASGTVALMATVGTDGRVKAVKIVNGDALLAQAAQDAVMQWRYRPSMLNGVPVESETRIMLNFVGQSLPSSEPGPPNGHGTRAAVLIHRTEPEAPQDTEGTVRLRAKIGADGKPTEIQIEEGNAILADSALKAVKQWVYRPATLNGEAVQSETTIVLRFEGKH